MVEQVAAPQVSRAPERSKGDRFGPHTASRLAAGPYQSFAVGLNKEQPQLFAWGLNADNTLGIGIKWEEALFPTLVEALEKKDVFEVSTGHHHTCILLKKPDSSGGKLHSVGLGTYGRLGYPRDKALGPPSDPESEEAWFADLPYHIRFSSDPEVKVKIARVVCGSDHTLCLTDHGEIYTFGLNSSGQCGIEGASVIWEPQKIPLAFGEEDEFVCSIAAGSRHSACCTRAGRVYVWGAGGNGRLGLGSTISQPLPILLFGLAESRILVVAAGEAHTAAIDRAGQVYTWGAGAGGRLGHGKEDDALEPIRVAELENVIIRMVKCGGTHTLAIDDAGNLLMWGVAEGQRVSTPRRIPCDKVLYIAAGSAHSLVMTENGDVLSWGRGDRGRLGHADHADQPAPKYVAELRGRGFMRDALSTRRIGSRHDTLKDEQTKTAANRQAARQVACGMYHTLILTCNREVYACGSNVKGQLGLGEHAPNHCSEPVKVPLPTVETFRAVAAGDRHSVFVSEAGNAYVCGEGPSGQLGTGSTTAQYFSPVKLPRLVGVIGCACGPDYTALIVLARGTVAGGGTHTSAGELWTFGSCDSAKLGHANLAVDFLTEPRKVFIQELVTKVACGESHMLALTATGRILAWGAGSFGRLGTGSLSNAYEPTEISNPGNVVFKEIGCGQYYSIALTSQGQVRVWGRAANVCGVTDLSVATDFSLQLDINGAGIPKVSEIVAGFNHAGVITTMGRMLAWGENRMRQVTGKAASSKSPTVTAPVFIEQLEAVEISGMGYDYTVACTRRGEIYSWGSTQWGKLGIGESAKKHTSHPISVAIPWSLAPEKALAKAMSITGNILSLSADEVLLELHRDAEPSFRIIQAALQAELPARREAALIQLEEDLTTVLGRHIDWLLHSALQLGAKGRKLSYNYNNRITKLAMLTGAQVPFWRKSLNPTVTAKLPYGLPGTQLAAINLISKLRNKILEFQKIVDCLLLQPSYWVVLAPVIDMGSELEVSAFCMLLGQIYPDLHDARTEAYYLAVLRGLAVREVEAVQEIERLFESGQSLFATVMTYFIVQASEVLDSLASRLIQMEHGIPTDAGEVARRQEIAESATNAVNLIDLVAFGTSHSVASAWIYFTASIEEYKEQLQSYQTRREKMPEDQQKLHPSAAEVLESPVALLEVFQASNEFLTHTCKLMVSAGLLRVPNLVLVIFRAVMLAMQRRDLLTLGAHSPAERWLPMIRVWFIQVVGPMLINASSYIDFLAYTDLNETAVDVERVINNLAFLGHLLVQTAAGAVGPEYVLLKGLGDQIITDFAEQLDNAVFNAAVDDIDSYDVKEWRRRDFQAIDRGPCDFLDTQLTMAFYTDHYSALETPSQQLCIDWWLLMFIANLIYKNEPRIKTLTTFDELIAAVRALADTQDPFLDTEVETARQLAIDVELDSRFPGLGSLRGETFYVTPAFLLQERNVIYDGTTRAPVPQRLAFRQRARTVAGQATLTLIQRLPLPDSSDPRTAIAVGLREAPAIDVKTFADLAFEFKAAQDAFSRADPPDYERASMMGAAAETAASMGQDEKRNAPRKFMFHAALELRRRYEHFRYLERLKQGSELLSQIERELQDRLTSREEVLADALADADTLTADSTLATVVESLGIQPCTWSCADVYRKTRTRDVFPPTTGALSPEGVEISLFIQELQLVGIMPASQLDSETHMTQAIILKHPNVTDHTVPWEVRFQNTSRPLELSKIEQQPYLSTVIVHEGCPAFYAGPLASMLRRVLSASDLPKGS